MQMRKASLILGIIGSCIVAAVALLYILIAALPDASLFSLFSNSLESVWGNSLAYNAPLFYVTGLSGAVAFAVGLTGCLLLKKKRVAAGVLFIVAGVLAIMCSYITTVLFILSGIFALVKAKPPLAAYGAGPMPPPPPAPGGYAPPPSYPPPYGYYPPPHGTAPGAFSPPPPPYGAAPGAYPPPPPPYGAAPGAYPPPPYGAAPGAYPPPLEPASNIHKEDQ
jgi:hypothetical protein